jgi:hypothetical protein
VACEEGSDSTGFDIPDLGVSFSSYSSPVLSFHLPSFVFSFISSFIDCFREKWMWEMREDIP